MKMSKIRKNAWVIALIFFLVECWFCECEGCWKHERDALLHLKAIAGFNIWINNEWVNGTDCCQWERVECSNTTGRVSELDLSEMRNYSLGNWYLNLSNFQDFEEIKNVDLSKNRLAGFVESKGNERFIWRTSIEALVLSVNSLRNDFISSLNGFQHLKSLDLSYNQLEGSLDMKELCALNNLEMLDLSYNYNISGFVVPRGANICLSSLKELHLNRLKTDASMLQTSLRGFSSIRKLHMKENTFNGTIVAGDFGELVNLEYLELDGSSNIGNEFLENIGVLSRLKFLSATCCGIKGIVSFADFGDVMNLEHLALDESSNIGNDFLVSIGALSSLKFLSASSCGIKGIVSFAGWSNLKNLEELYLSNNELEGPLDLSFINLTSLKRLDISNNSFTGNFASNLATFTSLEYLDFSSNQFQVLASFRFLANYSNLKFIDGSDNRIIPDPHPTFQTWVPKFQLEEFRLSSTIWANSAPLPNFLIHQYNLTSIVFSGINYQGNFPNWLLANNTKLRFLSLANCSFTGQFQLPSHVIPNLMTIDVSNNSITGQFPNNISAIFPGLSDLDMSRNAMNGSLPPDFGYYLRFIDLSDNHFSEMPRNLSVRNSAALHLRLSNNILDGSMCPTSESLDSLTQLYLDGNKFSGSIPSCIFNSSLWLLDISNNHFVGKLPNVVGNLSRMMALSIANNHLEGSIPTKFIEQPRLMYLDLSRNNISGSVPSFVHSLAKYILLDDNRLSGLETLTMFNESLPLVMLDLSNNNITGELQHLLASISQLNILLLRGNHFMGQIPSHMCQFKNLTMVDISYNSLSGPIPNCLSKIPFDAHETLLPYYSNYDYGDITRGDGYYLDLQVTFTTKWKSYTYKGSIVSYMSGMDLSHNNLNGSIPPELGHLMHIHAMNLSHNHLRGQIPITFSNLKDIESLDLSFNNLSDAIPHQLTELSFLAVFSVAHNNLSGSTPERKGQFWTFGGSSYEGNPFLCGPPLNKTCRPSVIFPNTSNVEASYNGGMIDMEFFYISFVVSYILILVVMVAVLYINPQWRRAWFYFIEYVITYCYYNFHKWFR